MNMFTRLNVTLHKQLYLPLIVTLAITVLPHTSALSANNAPSQPQTIELEITPYSSNSGTANRALFTPQQDNNTNSPAANYSTYSDDCSDGSCSMPPAIYNEIDSTPPKPLAIYWVDDNGKAAWSNSKSSTPLSGSNAASLATANANAKPGDLIYMRAGNYPVPIIPKRSGTKANPIVFKRYKEENVTFDGLKLCIELSNKHYIVVDGINCFRTNDAWALLTDKSSNNTIKNSKFKTSYSWMGIAFWEGANRNKILNNSFEATCERTIPCPGKDGRGSCLEVGEGGPADTIDARGGGYNLIENNYWVQGGTHYSIGLKSNYNIIRGNRIRNSWHGNLDMAIGYATRNLIDNNLFLEAGKERKVNFCGQGRDVDMPAYKQNQIGYATARNTIIRRNAFIDGGVFGGSNWRGDTMNQRIYNNTFYKNYINYRILGTSPEYRFDGEVFLNNITAKAVQDEVATSGPGSYGNTICNNNIWNATGAKINFGSNNTCNNSNTNVDPQFIKEAAIPTKSDLRLKPSSPMIDKGAWLTTVTSKSGSGRVFKVADASFFADGYGIALGDEIQLEGHGTPVRVVKIDYKTNTMTVDKSISWNKGDGVALPYSGNAPDIGAYEWGK